MYLGEDTDLIVLLVYWYDISKHQLLMRSDVNRTRGVKANIEYDIRAIRTSLHDDVVKCLFMLHAFTGCDTTSRIFSIGKQTVLKRLISDAQFRSDALLFSSADLIPADVDTIGCRIMVQLFGGKTTDTLSYCRYRQLVGKVQSAKTFVSPERLPPTASATKYHSLRNYLQVRVWQDTASNMDPSDWGWYQTNEEYRPKKMDLPAAPEALLKIVRCNCNSGCNTMKCGCRRNGLKCSTACGNCQESVCDNVDIDSISTTDEDSDISDDETDN